MPVITEVTLLTDIKAKQEEIDLEIGEVQANPTANTVLDRLKTIATNTSGGGGGGGTTLPTIAPTQTFINVSAHFTYDDVVYTVTTGKTFYCLGVIFTTSDIPSDVSLTNDAVEVVQTHVSLSVGTAPSQIISGQIIFVSPSETEIILQSNGMIYVTMWGYES